MSRDAGPRAEGEGYWLVAEAAKWYGHEEVRQRAFTEASARQGWRARCVLWKTLWLMPCGSCRVAHALRLML